jgi:hypothetical protein
MIALDRFNETAKNLEMARNEVDDADFLFNYEKYDAARDKVAELESELKINWIRLQIELGMEVSIASVMA